MRSGGIWIGQPVYVESILQKLRYENAKAVTSPVNTSLKLVKATKYCDPGLYHSAVGSLLYLSTRMRPDIMYAVSNVTRFCVKLTEWH